MAYPNGSKIRVKNRSLDTNGKLGIVRRRDGDQFLVLLEDGYYCHCREEEMERLDDE